MASWNGSSLTPSRPAPPVPGGLSSSSASMSATGSGQGGGLRPLLTSSHSSSTFQNGSSSFASSLTRGMNGLSLSNGGSNAGSNTNSYNGSIASRSTSNLFGAGSNSPLDHRNSSSSLHSSSNIIREGPVSTKEDGIRSMFFSKRWALLRTNALTFHKNKEVRQNFQL